MSERLEASQNDVGKQTQKLRNPHGVPQKHLNLKDCCNPSMGWVQWCAQWGRLEQRQEDGEFMDSLSYTPSAWPAWAI